MKTEQHALYREASILFEEKKFQEVIKMITDSPEELQETGAILILLADSYYEVRNDLKALECYAKYIVSYPNGRALQFALFNASISLKNLGLEEKAKEVLDLIKLDHPGLDNEIQDSLVAIQNRNAALKSAKTILGNIVK